MVDILVQLTICLPGVVRAEYSSKSGHFQLGYFQIIQLKTRLEVVQVVSQLISNDVALQNEHYCLISKGTNV